MPPSWRGRERYAVQSGPSLTTARLIVVRDGLSNIGPVERPRKKYIPPECRDIQAITRACAIDRPG